MRKPYEQPPEDPFRKKKNRFVRRHQIDDRNVFGQMWKWSAHSTYGHFDKPHMVQAREYLDEKVNIGLLEEVWLIPKRRGRAQDVDIIVRMRDLRVWHSILKPGLNALVEVSCVREDKLRGGKLSRVKFKVGPKAYDNHN